MLSLMANVNGDDNGVIETCDEASAHCDDCDWQDDGSGSDMIERATDHVDETGHTVSINATYYGTVSP